MPFISSVRGNYSAIGAKGVKAKETEIDVSGITGGTITTAGGYRYHTFTTATPAPTRLLNTSTVSQAISVDYLIVAGGGGGGGWGGGGGAGGYRSGTSAISPSSYPIAVGDGGTRGTNAYTNGGAGQNSSFNGVSSLGGGGGGAFPGGGGQPGGSGGGAGGQSFPNPGAAGTGTPGQGNPGGIDTHGGPFGGAWGGWGGGGGAGAVGGNPLPGPLGAGGPGGNGIMWPGNVTSYAGGGAGHNGNPPAPTAQRSSGGSGGGGAGGWYPGIFRGENGQTNTGGGGGGSYGEPSSATDAGQACGAGGSGIVIVRYASPYPTA